ncbi:MAG: hypothetical protein HWD61_14915 [Parachlamydiaceae bacterium]|nr:MAG: hypothetical protein HWD61_14915 [Parachlamydiaceae bacterium]
MCTTISCFKYRSIKWQDELQGWVQKSSLFIELLSNHSLPLSLQEPLKCYLLQIEKESSFESSAPFTAQSEDFHASNWDYYLGTGSALAYLAIEVAKAVDGYDFRHNGIRLRVHQPRDGKAKTRAYILKVLKNFSRGADSLFCR